MEQSVKQSNVKWESYLYCLKGEKFINLKWYYSVLQSEGEIPRTQCDCWAYRYCFYSWTYKKMYRPSILDNECPRMTYWSRMKYSKTYEPIKYFWRKCVSFPEWQNLIFSFFRSWLAMAMSRNVGSLPLDQSYSFPLGILFDLSN